MTPCILVALDLSSQEYVCVSRHETTAEGRSAKTSYDGGEPLGILTLVFPEGELQGTPGVALEDAHNLRIVEADPSFLQAFASTRMV